jgi:phage-related tail fiber protein
MFTLNKCLLAGLVVIAGEIIMITPSMAQQHDTSSVTTNQSSVHNSVPNVGINGLFNPKTGKFEIKGSNSINLNDSAKLMGESLQKSLNDLAEANQEPRRFARRRSTDCANTAIQIREEVQSKLEESQKFIEQVEKMSPDMNSW